MAKRKKTTSNLVELIDHVEHANEMCRKINPESEFLITVCGNLEGYGVAIDGNYGLIIEGIATQLEALLDRAPDSTFEELLKQVSEAHALHCDQRKADESAGDEYSNPGDVFEKEKTDLS